MSNTPPLDEQELEADGLDESLERGLSPASSTVPKSNLPGGNAEPSLPDNGGMTPDQDAIGSG